MRNILGRTNVKKDPVKDFDSCEDFFITVVHSLILGACMAEFRINRLDESQSESVASDDEWLNTEHSRTKLINSLCNRVVSKYVKFYLLCQQYYRIV